MSYQERFDHVDVVVCDICGRCGAIGNRDWREMRQDEHGAAIHLCRTCRRSALWCAAHEQYHLAESLHRRPCIVCGGLFTSKVGQNIEHCPQCRRTLSLPPARTPNRSGADLVASLLTLVVRQLEAVKMHRHI